MPTTSNFGWTTPADTDLVKDGAAAIRTLGNGIDTSLVDLKGGTTGQVLSKASNTDLDFTWSSVDPLTILDAKGDLITATAADTPARLAVGTNGQYLQADSTTSTGLKWATPTATGANWTLLNSGGTSLTGAATVTVSGISGADKIAVFIVGASSVNANAFITVRLNADTGSNYYAITNYWVVGSTYDPINTTGNASQWPGNTIYLARTRSGDATGGSAGAVTFSGCNSSGVKTFISQGGGYQNSTNHNWELYHNQGYYNSSSTISSVSVFSTSGNLDAGTVYVYTSA